MQIEKWDEVNGSGTPEQRMEAFLVSSTDSYAILQLKDSSEFAYERFSSMRELNRMGMEPNIDHYEVVYANDLAPFKDLSYELERMFQQFNVDHPEDFRGHSLSVSDIVALRQNDVVSCYYVDPVGFKELPGFLKPENYLKNVEMAMEDDYGMIDGILNNGKSAAAEERPSVLEQLRKDRPEPEKPKKPRHPPEMER